MSIKKMKQILIFVLIFALSFGNLTFATNTEVDVEVVIDKGQNVKIDKDLQTMDIDDETEVRIIVELEEEPVIFYATKKGVKVTDLESTERMDIEERIAIQKSETIAELTENSVEMKLLNSYQNVFNGFAANVKYGDVKKIAKNNNVKNVSYVNEYAMPEPQMNKSGKLTRSKFAHDLDFDGRGLVVSIIDSGIDWTHKDLVVDADIDVKLSEAQVNAIKDVHNLPGKYYSEKVPYGYNYMDRSEEIRDFHPAVNMHGMHVAGTVGANAKDDNGIIGVAPNVQLLGMKVFSNDTESPTTYGDIIVAAIDDSIALGADVMNLSLGATAQWVDPEDPEQVAVKRAVDNGILMSISAGNSAAFGAGYSEPFLENPDVGVVGSPGLTPSSLQVASIDNYKELYVNKVSFDGYEALTYGASKWEEKGYKLTTIGGKVGYPEDFVGVDCTGKVVLVKRGEISFYDKNENAKNAGAIGIIVYNNDITRHFYKNQGDWFDETPFMMMQVSEGNVLENIVSGGDITIDVEEVEAYSNPDSGKISYFSSWGTTSELNFKPEISAPGGGIYSTLNNDQYGYKSGTSMAAPHVSGGAAVIAQRISEDPDLPQLTGTAKTELLKNILMNTATPIIDSEFAVTNDYNDAVAYADVRAQGAGSMNLELASTTKVVITEKETGIAKVALGEVDEEIKFELEVKNYGQTKALFNVHAMAQTNQVGFNDEGLLVNSLTSAYLENCPSTIKVDGEILEGNLEVAPNGSKTVEVTINIANPIFHYGKYSLLFNDYYENGNFINGFVLFNPVDEDFLTEKEALYVAYEAKVSEQESAKTLMDEASTLVNEKNVELATAKNVLATLETELATLETTYAGVITKIEELNSAEAAVATAQTVYDDIVADNASISEDTIAALEADIETKENELNTLNDELTALQETHATVSGEKTTLDSELTTLKNTLTEMNTALENLKTEKTDLETAKAELEAKVSPLETDISNLKAEKIEKEGLVSGLETAKTDAQTAVDAQKNLIAAAEQALADAEESEKPAKQAELDALKEALPAKEAALTAAEKAVTDNEALITTLGESIATKESELETTQTAIEGKTSAIADKVEEISTKESEITTQNGLVNTKQAAVDAKEAEVTTAKTNLDTKQAEVDTKNNEIADLEEQVALQKASLAAEPVAKTALDEAIAARDAVKERISEADENEYALYTSEKAAVKAQIAEKEVLIVDLEEELEALKADHSSKSELYLTLGNEIEAALKAYNDAKNEKYATTQLSVPYLAFKGDFGDAPAFDKLAGTPGSFYGETWLMSKKDETSYYLLATEKVNENKTIYFKDNMSISPNGDDFFDTLTPAFTCLRNMHDMSFKVYDDNDDLVKTIALNQAFNKNYYDYGDKDKKYTKDAYTFDGTVRGKKVEDGQYYYVITGKTSDKDNTEHELVMPFFVDVSKPTIDSIDYENGAATMTINASDETSGVQSYYVKDLGANEKLYFGTNKEIDLTSFDDAATLLVVALDYAGNESASEIIVVNDDSRPEILIDFESLSVLNTKNPEFNITINDVQPSSLVVRLDELAEQTLDVTVNDAGQQVATVSYENLAEGRHNFYVQATDLSGNELSYSRQFFVDSIRPTIEVTSDDIISDEDIKYVNYSVESVAVKANITEELFSTLEVVLNDNVIHFEENGWIYYDEQLLGASYTIDETVDLAVGLNKILIEVYDASGEKVVYEQDIYRLKENEATNITPPGPIGGGGSDKVEVPDSVPQAGDAAKAKDLSEEAVKDAAKGLASTKDPSKHVESLTSSISGYMEEMSYEDASNVAEEVLDLAAEALLKDMTDAKAEKMVNAVIENVLGKVDADLNEATYTKATDLLDDYLTKVASVEVKEDEIKTEETQTIVDIPKVRLEAALSKSMLEMKDLKAKLESNDLSKVYNSLEKNVQIQASVDEQVKLTLTADQLESFKTNDYGVSLKLDDMTLAVPSATIKSTTKDIQMSRTVASETYTKTTSGGTVKGDKIFDINVSMDDVNVDGQVEVIMPLGDMNPDQLMIGVYENDQWTKIPYTIEGTNVCFTAPHFSVYGMLTYEASFTDIEHWAKPYIVSLAAKGVVSGKSEHNFDPDGAITRAEFATIIVNHLELNDAVNSNFKDVAEDAWYYNHVGLAGQYSISAGSVDGMFRPDDIITREEMAAMLYRAYEVKNGYKMTGTAKVFSDNGSVAAYAKEAVNMMRANGIISGYDDNTFRPQETASRAEASTMMYMFLSK